VPYIRVVFSLASSYSTPFQADTIFGHLCWSAAYLEGDEALAEFLSRFESEPPLLVSDAFPAIRMQNGDKPIYYLPRPTVAPKEDDIEEIEKLAGKNADQSRLRLLFTALKTIEKKAWLSESALLNLRTRLNWKELVLAFLRLDICPAACIPRSQVGCQCTDWTNCPALETTERSDACKHPVKPHDILSPVMHNVINRWSGTSENVFTDEERFPGTDFHFIARLDGSTVTESRLRAWVEYMAESGFGRDASTGKGAMKDVAFETFDWTNDDADWFLNISSAYVPKKGELPEGSYAVHVKRGKIGGTYVLYHSPWKKPILMIQAGAVLRGSPAKIYGQLVPRVHYTLPQVVQYGYAFPLGVIANV